MTATLSTITGGVIVDDERAHALDYFGQRMMAGDDVRVVSQHSSFAGRRLQVLGFTSIDEHGRAPDRLLSVIVRIDDGKQCPFKPGELRLSVEHQAMRFVR